MKSLCTETLSRWIYEFIHLLWIVPSVHQWMAVGVSGRHGILAVWRAEWDTGHVLAHAPIQHQNTERIALVPACTQRAAICTSVKVAAFFRKIFPKMIPAYFDALLSSLLFISGLSYFFIFRIFYDCTDMCMNENQRPRGKRATFNAAR